MATWNENSPADTDLIKDGDDAIRQLKVDVRERMDNEHVWSSTGTNSDGTHASGFLVDAYVHASAAIAESKLSFNTSTGHRHSGTDSRKVLTTNLDVTGLTVSQLIRTNAGGTALESSGKIVPTGDIVGTSDSQTLTNKTLTTPTIGDFTNANHAHNGGTSGGQINHTSLSSVGTNTHAQIDTAVTNSTSHIAANSNSVHGITATPAEINKLSGLVTTAAELGVLSGIPGTLTSTELGYCDGVTSSIQTQLNTKSYGITEITATLILNLTNSGDVTWQDVDVTSYRTGSAPAKYVVLRVEIDPKTSTNGVSVLLSFRKNGTTNTFAEAFALRDSGGATGIYWKSQVIVPVDTDEIFEYNIDQDSGSPDNRIKVYMVGFIS